MCPYTITFEATRGNVSEIKGSSATGLTVQTRTITEGVSNTTSEVQMLTFVATVNLSQHRRSCVTLSLQPPLAPKDALHCFPKRPSFKTQSPHAAA